MSREERILRGVTNVDLKQMIKKALDAGWEMGPVSGSTHCYIYWPKTNEKVGFGTTVSDRHFWKSFARQVEKISGIQLVEKHNRGRARHKPTKGQFIATYRPQSQETVSEIVEHLSDEYRDLVLEFAILASADVNHSDINRALQIIRRMAKIETTLKALRQPIPNLEFKIPGIESLRREK